MVELYTPFDKEFEEVGTSDLLELMNVHEGWYVDYKSAPLKPRDYAKAISAMANTYGGWIFIGIEEKSKDDNVAGSFPGVSEKQVDMVRQQVRQSVKDHLQPSPHFDIRAIGAPDAKSNEKVVCLLVPPSNKAPIIHSDGRIYRRLNDASEPVPETDRSVVDHLLRRDEKIEQLYAKWDDDDPITLSTENELSYIRILMVPDYWEDTDLYLDSHAAELREIMNQTEQGASYGGNFDTIYSQHGGFVCRQINSNNPQLLNYTFKIDRKLRNELILPLDTFRLNSAANRFRDRPVLKELVSFLVNNRYGDCSAIDLGMMFGAIDAAFSIQKKLEEKVGYDGKTHVKLKLCNVWQKIPVLDAPPEKLRWDEFGVPLILSRDITVRPGGSLQSFIEVDLHKRHFGPANPYFGLSILPLISICNALGLNIGELKDLSELVAKLNHLSLDQARR
ncbi:helix-turn-helix domain-containing protein [Roseovarius indicus]|uniref:AlbA family DNA-binding domain-containing protein n=1 Tax=Roseovarius indicus TaxID=540747 RepID=UPI0009EF4CD6|nr:ATP-binding protein [Roseovarius indicus]